MPKIETSAENIPGTGPITDPRQLKEMEKVIKKRFENISPDTEYDDFHADRIKKITKGASEEFIEEGISNEIH